MHPTALLDLATELLRAVLKLDAPADSIVSNFFKRHRSLGPRERHALAETAYTVLRRRPLLQHLAQSGTGALERRLAILAWSGDANLLKGALDTTKKRRISWAKASSEPAMASARATQASLPDCTIMPWSNSLTVTGVCGSMNILEPGTFQALGDTGMVWSRVSVLPLTAAKAR